MWNINYSTIDAEQPVCLYDNKNVHSNINIYIMCIYSNQSDNKHVYSYIIYTLIITQYKKIYKILQRSISQVQAKT